MPTVKDCGGHYDAPRWQPSSPFQDLLNEAKKLRAERDGLNQRLASLDAEIQSHLARPVQQQQQQPQPERPFSEES